MKTVDLHETAPPAFWLGTEGAQDASSPVLDGVAGDDASAIGPAPPPATAAALLAIVVGAYPNGGNCLEAATRTAIELGWAARHHLIEGRPTMPEQLGLTGNAFLLLGTIGGLIDSAQELLDYRVQEVNASEGWIVVEHTGTGNTHRVWVTQVGGTR